MLRLARISKLKPYKTFRRFSNAAVKLYHRSEFDRMKNEGIMMTTENVLTKVTNRDGISYMCPTPTIPTRLQVTVPQKNHNPAVGVDEDETFSKHFVGPMAYSENMMQYAKEPSDEPGRPQGAQGFLWRLTRPLEAFKKRFVGAVDEVHQTKEKVEPIKATTQGEVPPKIPLKTTRKMNKT